MKKILILLLGVLIGCNNAAKENKPPVETGAVYISGTGEVFIGNDIIAAGSNMRSAYYKSDESPFTGRLEYYREGRLSYMYPYVDGKLEGVLKVYHKNGKLSVETPVREGKEHGISKAYHDNGKIRSESPFTNGILNGTVIFYSPKGNKTAEMPYINGVLEGTALEFNSKGEIWAITEYKNGKIVTDKF